MKIIWSPMALERVQGLPDIRLKLPDAIITATALHLGLLLVARNVKDFKDIPEWSLINPFGN
jgi:predicted nucleic acid-binding protein